MKPYAIPLGLAACLLTGCQSPLQRVLTRYPHWETSAKHLAAEPSSDTSGLVREAFPDVNNPLHLEIWNALWKKGNVGDGFGWICNYNPTASGRRCYLVVLSELRDHGFVSYFYVPSKRWLLDASDSMALSYYGGDRSATLENVRQLVAHLSVLRGYEAFAVESPADIPHGRFQKENTHVAFTDFLSSKGVAVTPPRFRLIEDADYGAYSECNLFVYMPCGGQLFRYEVRCQHEKIIETRRFLVATLVGDWWGIM